MRCELCGATATKGRRCGDCQSIPGMKLADENEREELRAYHEQLRQARGKDLDHLLATGPLPDDPQCLTDAGLAMVPMIESSEACARLEAIVAKLRLAPRSATVASALRDLEEKLARQRATDRKFMIGCVAFFGALAVAGLMVLAWWLFVER